MPEVVDKPSITLVELSRLTGVPRRVLWRAVRTGQLPAWKAKGSRHWRVWVESDAFQRLFESNDQPEQPAEVNAT